MEAQVVRTHGGTGLTCFGIALVVLFLFFLLIAVATTTLARFTQSDPSYHAFAGIIGYLGAVLLTVDLAAIVLGVVGLRDATSKKLFSILGIVLAAVMFAAFALGAIITV